MLERLFSVGEAAAMLGGVSKWTVHSWISQGKLTRTKIGGRTMVSEGDLKKFIQSCNAKPVLPQLGSGGAS